MAREEVSVELTSELRAAQVEEAASALRLGVWRGQGQAAAHQAGRWEHLPAIGNEGACV